MPPRILFIDIAALGYDLLAENDSVSWHGFEFSPIESVFPAVTCTVQGTLRTALPPARHGMVFNGVYLRELRRPSFWEQSSALVQGERIWTQFRKRGGTVGMLFWQQSLGEEVDVLLSPWPVHKHGGSLVDTTHGVPGTLYGELRRQLGRPFRLRDYWGPLSGLRSTRWIADATRAVLRSAQAPDLLFTYLPHLDYAQQKYGPGHPRSARSLKELLGVLSPLIDDARRRHYEVILAGDYAIGAVEAVLHPNRVLRDAGLLTTRDVAGRCYVNPHESRAFAVVDHEAAHVYVRSAGDRDLAANALREAFGSHASVLTGEEFAGGATHNAIGELVLAGRPGTWFAYPWWRDTEKPPDFASHIDIHNKPGFDPCELFFGRTPLSVSTDPTRVLGTHGAIGAGRSAAWAATCSLPSTPQTLLELAEALRAMLAQDS